MNNHTPSSHALIVETEWQLSLVELSRVCAVEVATVEDLVHEGVLVPRDTTAALWMFDCAVLPRARRATRLVRELELNPAGVALVVELLDEIESLKSRLDHLT